MITDERTAAFIESFDAGNTELLEELERYALANRVPIIKRPVQSLLKFVLSAKHPERILEVGTAIGFSAILMAEYGREVSQIVTIENYEKRIPIALDNFKRAGMADRITLIAEDAAEALESLCKSDERFDMIFVDAAKAQYINYLPFVKAMLNDGGLLISDNVLHKERAMTRIVLVLQIILNPVMEMLSADFITGTDHIRHIGADPNEFMTALETTALPV